MTRYTVSIELDDEQDDVADVAYATHVVMRSTEIKPDAVVLHLAWWLFHGEHYANHAHLQEMERPTLAAIHDAIQAAVLPTWAT